MSDCVYMIEKVVPIMVLTLLNLVRHLSDFFVTFIFWYIYNNFRSGVHLELTMKYIETRTGMLCSNLKERSLKLRCVIGGPLIFN